MTHPARNVADMTRADATVPGAEHPVGDDVSFAVVDVETTGIDPARDRIIQMAAVVVNTRGEVVEEWTTVVRPESPDEYRHGAEHIHGISADEVEAGMPLSEALATLWSMSRGRVFTAHNARFDIGFLHAESERVGLENRVESWVDTLEISRRIDTGRTRRHSLEALCAHYGIERERAHEAHSDASATARLLFTLAADLGLESPGQLPGVVR